MIDQICILAPAEYIDEIRSTATAIPKFSEASKLLNIKLSPTGEEPATHYFCASNYSNKTHKSILDLKRTRQQIIQKFLLATQKNF